MADTLFVTGVEPRSGKSAIILGLMKFPELSAELLKKKLANAEKTGAELLLTDCPGCIMQLRGGLEAKGSAMRVAHVAEALAERLK